MGTKKIQKNIPEISVNSNKLKVKDANPSGVSGSDSLYRFQVTVVGTYGSDQSMDVTTDPTIRNRTGGIGG